MKLTFCWQGVSDPNVWNSWDDGLALAMKLLENEYEVIYQEPWEHLTGDKILYWEAPCTAQGKNAGYYDNVRFHPQWKALLFAGGPVQKEWIEGFDHVFYESDENADDFHSASKAFGVNTEVFKPMHEEKKYDAILHATFADWKRHKLFADAFGERGLAVGKIQDGDREGYEYCLEKGVQVMDKQPRSELAKLINQSEVAVNTASYWGGGQRTTLEVMACGVPVIVMEDSPKNCEYIEDSGVGAICKPEPELIRTAWEKVDPQPEKSLAYVHSKWTPYHYAEAIKQYL